MSAIETVTNVLNPIYDAFWIVAFVVLIGGGIYSTIKLKGLQVTKLWRGIKLTFEKEKQHNGKTVSSFQAFCIGMGTRIGVGNIAGVATAIMMGGPGAIFWMWVFALIGAATSFMESTLSQIYKEKKEDGEFFGGPAYYASKGTGNRKVGKAVAILLTLTLGFGFIAVEADTASTALCEAFTFANNEVVFAIVIAALTGFLITGGVLRIAKFSAMIVPAMALSWIAFTAVLLCINYSNIPAAFSMIFHDAFAANSLVGGGVGTAISIGLQRGVFSNDSGLATVANVAAVADVKHPVKQGLIQSFGVLVDTLLLCTLTALVILTYGSFESLYTDFDGALGSALVQGVAADAVGNWIKIVIAAFLLVFSFTSLAGDYVSSESNIRFIKDDMKWVNMLRIGIIIIAVVTVFMDTDFVDLVCFTFIALMAILNVSVILYKRKVIFECYDDYNRQIDEGIEEPVFVRDVLSDPSGITEWSKDDN